MEMIDLRDSLPRNWSGGPDASEMGTRRGAVIHYNGPPVPVGVNEADWLEAIAQYHIDKNWSPGSPGHTAGDGIMYHLAVGRRGHIYRMRSDPSVLWHCGSWPENRTHWSIYVLLGGDQRATPDQLEALHGLVDHLLRRDGFTRAAVLGHMEVDWTECPGTLMEDFVLAYRDGVEMTTDGKWFAETECYLGGAFWQFWQQNGGLRIFGYPITNETEEDGRTVQYFQRAVFEWHPGAGPGYEVQLRLIGVEALSAVE